MPELIQEIFVKQLPTIFIMTIILISVRIAYVMRFNKKAVIYKELLTLSFIIYIICLFYIVTYNDSTVPISNNFIPFREITRYEFLSYGFMKNILGNVLMFIPFGYFVSLYLKPNNLNYIFVLTFIASLSIEFTQLVTNRRIFDVDDIILNVVGGIIGYLLYIGFDAIGNKLPKFFKSDLFLNFVVIILFIFFFIYTFNIFGIDF